MAFGVLMFVAAFGILVFGPRLTRHNVALHSSTEDLRATSGSTHRRVRAMTILGYVANVLMADFLIYMGVRFLGG